MDKTKIRKLLAVSRSGLGGWKPWVFHPFSKLYVATLLSFPKDPVFHSYAVLCRGETDHDLTKWRQGFFCWRDVSRSRNRKQFEKISPLKLPAIDIQKFFIKQFCATKYFLYSSHSKNQCKKKDQQHPTTPTPRCFLAKKNAVSAKRQTASSHPASQPPRPHPPLSPAAPRSVGSSEGSPPKPGGTGQSCGELCWKRKKGCALSGGFLSFLEGSSKARLFGGFLWRLFWYEEIPGFFWGAKEHHLSPLRCQGCQPAPWSPPFWWQRAWPRLLIRSVNLLPRSCSLSRAPLFA